MFNIIILFLLIIGGIFLFYSDNKEDIVHKEEVKKDITISNNKKIKILYLDDTNSNTSLKIDSNIKKDIKVIKKKVSKKKVIDYSKIDSMDKESTMHYIEQNNLIDVTAHNTNEEHSVPPRFSVYSDISEEEAKANRDQNLPPMAPVIANGIFKSGQTYTVIIPAVVKENANTIIVTDNSPDGTPIEAVVIPTQSDIDQQEEDDSQSNSDNFTIAPPSIGQNN